MSRKTSDASFFLSQPLSRYRFYCIEGCSHILAKIVRYVRIVRRHA